MFERRFLIMLVAIISIFTLAYKVQPISADWDVSFGVKSDSDPYNSYYGDRITTEYRRGYQTDDWVERGESSVTESPIFSDGIRLTSWATRDRDDYDYGIASAIYFFDVPSNARSLRIKVHYDGEGDNDDVGDEIAGRIWIKRTTQADDYEEYYPSEGRYESVDKPLYGDTFVLTAKKHLEIVRTSAQDHVNNDGIMELHLVAEGRQRLDVKYIEVETYTYMPTVRVITRYYKDYTWRPWYNYTYWYFYTGPVFHFSDYYYVRYTYPYYHRNYIEIRRYYDDYLRVYYVRSPHRYIYWDDVVYVRKGAPRSWHRERLSKWTPQHEETRRYYINTNKNQRTVEIQQSRERVRGVLSNTTKRSPSAERALSIQTRGSAVTDMKQRRDIEQRSTPDVRMRTSESRTIERTPARTETSDRERRVETRSSTDVKKSTQSNTERERVIRTVPQKSTSKESSKSAPSANTEVKKKQTETKKSETVQRRESSTETKKDTQVQNDKKDEEEDDEDKDKDKNTNRSNSGNSSDSSSRKKVRDR